jgi:tripartite-type tricarboxylate transporter receptor subunit TctC
MTALSRRFLLGNGVALALTSNRAWARTEPDWPMRPVRMISLAAAGGGTDAVARVLAGALAKRWGQPVLVDNRPGGEGIVSIETFLAAREGNHTLLFNPSGTWTTLHLMHDGLTFDTTRDLVPLSLVVQDFLAIAASPKFAAATVAEVVSLARASPEKITWASAPSVPYLAFKAFLKAQALELLYVPYRNPLGSIADLGEGRVDLAVLPLAPLVGPAQAGKLKLIVVASADHAPLAPQVPTVTEAGFPTLSINAAHCLFGPKEMPQPLRERIAADVREVLGVPEVKQRITAMGYVPRGTPTGEVAAFLARERAHWTGVAQAHGAKPSQ